MVEELGKTLSTLGVNADVNFQSSKFWFRGFLDFWISLLMTIAILICKYHCCHFDFHTQTVAMLITNNFSKLFPNKIAFSYLSFLLCGFLQVFCIFMAFYKPDRSHVFSHRVAIHFFQSCLLLTLPQLA